MSELTDLSVGKIDEVENANFSFNKKSHVDALLQRVSVEELASERAGSKKVLQKGNIMTHRYTHKKY